MPTGYTDKISEGIDFPQFAMNCARAFGALIQMRDDPMDASIPEEFEPSSFYPEQMEKAKQRLSELESMTDGQCLEVAREEFDREIATLQKCIQNSASLRSKYESMLESVRSWTPPSGDHVRLKEFMIEQIEMSIEADCNEKYFAGQIDEKKLLSESEWRGEAIELEKSAIARYAESYAKELEGLRKRNLWIKQLRDSLGISKQPTT